VPLTSKIDVLLAGEFVLKDWKSSGLNVRSVVKRGLFTVHQNLIIKTLGSLSTQDAGDLERSLRAWLGL
jgi:mRNA interferase MazF